MLAYECTQCQENTTGGRDSLGDLRRAAHLCPDCFRVDVDRIRELEQENQILLEELAELRRTLADQPYLF